jgi:uncharacterized protein (DUF697 family)
MSFWNVVKEVSTAPIRQEAERPFLLGIAGSSSFIDAVVEELVGPEATPQERALAEARLMRAPGPPSVEAAAALSRCDVVLAGEDAPEPARIRPAEVIAVADPARAPQLLLEMRPQWQLALARHLPGLRPMVADRLIHEISKVNAQWAMVTAVPKAVPILAFLFPSFAADLLVLTKNQVMMVIRLAAAYGRAPEPRARLREIMPVVGTALGWRALARAVMRELAGLIPAGAGLAIRATIAYTGTFAAGRAAVFYYSVGRHPTRIEMRGIRREGANRARTAVREALDSLRRQQ